MKIIVPKEELQAQRIEVNPNTFEPEVVVVINQNYYYNISQKYNIHKIYVDYSYLETWLNETAEGKRLRTEFNHVDTKTKIGRFITLDKNSFDYYNLRKWVDSMYNFNNSYITPVVLEVSEKEDTYSVRDATMELAKRYIDILEPLKNIEKDSLSSTSNSHLIKMCQTLIDNSSLPEDKISRWIGFIQGVMIMKGYITVDAERDYSRPLFHKVYESNGIEIPKNTL